MSDPILPIISGVVSQAGSLGLLWREPVLESLECQLVSWRVFYKNSRNPSSPRVDEVREEACKEIQPAWMRQCSDFLSGVISVREVGSFCGSPCSCNVMRS